MKHGPLVHTHQAAGAQMGERDGWLVPLRYGGAHHDCLADLSHWTKFDVRGVPKTDLASAVRCLALGGSHGLVLCPPSSRGAATAWIEAAGLSSTEVTGGYACLFLTGPHSREILAKLTSADLRGSSMPDGRVTQSSIAHAQGIIQRLDAAGSPAFWILTPRDYAESVWESFLHAGHEYHLMPIGLEEAGSL